MRSSSLLLAGSLLVTGCLFDRLSPSGSAGNTSAAVTADPDVSASLRRHVEQLAGALGPRSFATAGALGNAARYIEAELSRAGAGQATRLSYTIDPRWERAIRSRAWRAGCMLGLHAALGRAVPADGDAGAALRLAR